jgi:hypothetical protein
MMGIANQGLLKTMETGGRQWIRGAGVRAPGHPRAPIQEHLSYVL